MIEWGRERVRTGPWRGDRQVAYLTPVPDAPVPSPSFVRRCLDELAGQGFTRVVTGALTPGEQAGFLAAGFTVEERLHLLARDVTNLPNLPSGVRLRRALKADRPAVLAVDHLSFPPFWRLDDSGLDEAITATPRARFHAAEDDDGAIGGYAVTGRAGRRGYLQRLAVHPDLRHRRVGTALVVDGLRWCRRWRVERAVVNTQISNEAALALYLHLGFRLQPQGLSVLSAGLRG